MSSSDENLPLYNWKEITNEFKNACSDLNIGELVKDEQFEILNFF